MKLLKWAIGLFPAIPVFCNAGNCTDTLKPTSKIEPVGRYVSTNPNLGQGNIHFFYIVELWHADDCFFGSFSATESREGDAPFGLIDDFSYNHKSKAASFKSKLTIGVTYEGPGKPGKPSKDLFEFFGKFDKKQLSGTFKYVDKSDSAPAATQKVILRLEKNSLTYMTLKTYSAWLEDVHVGFQDRGPKW